MPRRRLVPVVTALLLLFWDFPAMAQEQRFKIGGGAGFAWPKAPVLELRRGFDLGGFLGVRFNDNFSVETNFSFIRTERQFTLADEPVVEPGVQISAYNLETTRYTMDGSLVYSIGRRQPFHPFIFGGAGMMREENKNTDLTPLLEPGVDPGDVELETTKKSDYYPVFSVGAGFDFYILYNVAARFEWRWWLSKDWDRRTMSLFASAAYYF